MIIIWERLINGVNEMGKQEVSSSILDNIIEIMKMGMSIVWSDLKRMMFDIIKVLNTRVKRVESVKNDKSSNGMNTRVKMVQERSSSSEEEEAYARQLYMMEMYRDVYRDENGFPIDLKSKLRNKKS